VPATWWQALAFRPACRSVGPELQFRPLSATAAASACG